MPNRRSIPRGAIRIHLPQTTQQTDYSCGASSLQAIASYYGVGPSAEREFVRDTGMDPRVGSHPDQIVKAATRYGLSCRLYEPMTLGQLHAELRRRHPVMLMIQAWGEERVGHRLRPRRQYKDSWVHGHWVVAIGHDRGAVYFEDPSLEESRGYLGNDELDERWHDTARHGRHVEHLGLAIWRESSPKSTYRIRAKRIP